MQDIFHYLPALRLDSWVPPAIVVAAIAAVPLARAMLRRGVERRLRSAAAHLAELAEVHFLCQPCSRCHESAMRLVDVSPNARSLAYECVHCAKKMRAPAATDTAAEAATVFADFLDALDQRRSRYGDCEIEILFHTSPAPLPFEQSRRTPIPEAVRAEVWRRDGGRSVACQATEHLEFDHIIPLAKGGATSVRNLQLLCRSCNASKGDGI